INFIGSKTFFILIIALAVIQGIWYALSFQPSIFDEGKHFARILFYTQHLSPFLGEQDPAWDSLGAISRDASYLFYYLMSFPLRLIQVFTDNPTVQLISLRIINLGIFVAGLFIYRKTLL